MSEELENEVNETNEDVIAKEEYDKVQQMVDQERGNAARARAEVEEYKGEVANMATQLDDLRAQIQAKASANEVDMDDLDASLADPAVIRSLRKQSSQLKQLTEDLSLAQHKIKQYEGVENQKQVQSAKDKTVESILSMCDEEYDAKYRNDAVAMADKLVDEGKEKQPGSVIEGLKLMQKCYKAVKKDTESKHSGTPEVVTDKGKGGFSFSQEDEHKPGSRKEILAEMKARIRAKKS